MQQLEQFADQLLCVLINHQDHCVEFLCTNVDDNATWITFDFDPEKVEQMVISIARTKREGQMVIPISFTSEFHQRLVNQPIDYWSNIGLSIVARVLFDKYLMVARARGLAPCIDASLALCGETVGDLP